MGMFDPTTQNDPNVFDYQSAAVSLAMEQVLARIDP
jgi:hypothetical protein